MSVKIYSIFSYFTIFESCHALQLITGQTKLSMTLLTTNGSELWNLIKLIMYIHLAEQRSQNKKKFTDSFSHRVLQYMLCLGCSTLWPGIATEGLGCRMLTLISTSTSLSHFSPVCLVGGTELLSSRAGCKSCRGQCFLPPSISFL